jgi:hypothetical protein
VNESNTKWRIMRWVNPKSRFFWMVALSSLMLWVWSTPCQTNNIINYATTTFLTGLVCLCFWESHVYAIQRGVKNKFSLFLQVTRRALIALLGVAGSSAAILFILVLISPHYSCYGDKAKVMEIILMLSNQREEITQRIQTAKTVANSGAGITIKKQGRIVDAVVTESGMMVAISQDPPSVVMFTPEFIKAADTTANGEVKWTCVGYPQKAMPMSCRPPLPSP